MNVLISKSGDPYIEDDAIYIDFVAIGKHSQGTLQVGFRVQYGWGATAAQRNSAIISAANKAKTDYEQAHGVTLPSVNLIEIQL